MATRTTTTRGICPDCGMIHLVRKDGTMHAHRCNGTYVSVTGVAAEIVNPSDEQIAALQSKSCGRCGYRADAHIHLFGSKLYLCPTVATFAEPQAAGAVARPDGSSTDGPRATKASVLSDPTTAVGES
jgi:hypothetical protein